ncbi:MAG: thiolase domain-containing protein, partial [Kiloniellales bacterium]|nr:thiolase domain-containing protein [Kiloniellales bacterium]
MTACIVGWAHTPFGKHESEDPESLIVRVAVEALADAGLEPEEVDEIVVGQFNEGFSPQAFPSSLVLQADERFRFKPATRVENACATGTAAIHQGLKTIAAKRGRFVLAVGVEKMTGLPGPEIGGVLLKASYLREEAEIEGGFAG